MRTLGMGVSSSLIAAAIAYWITDHHLITALVMGAAGIVGFVGTLLLSRKPQSPSPVSVNQDNKQEFNPQVNINPQFNLSLGNATASAATAPAPEKKDEPRCNIQFNGVLYLRQDQINVLEPYAGQTLLYAVAVFENKAVAGMELRTPTVRSRAIFRDENAMQFGDIPEMVWAQVNEAHTTMRANSPQHLLLFFSVNERLMVRVGETRRNRFARPFRDHELGRPVSSVEIQLLTDTEQLYTAILRFTDNGISPLPRFDSYSEL